MACQKGNAAFAIAEFRVSPNAVMAAHFCQWIGTVLLLLQLRVVAVKPGFSRTDCIDDIQERLRGVVFADDARAPEWNASQLIDSLVQSENASTLVWGACALICKCARHRHIHLTANR